VKLYMLMNYCASLAIVFMNKWAYNHVRTALATVQSHYIIHPPVRLPSFPRGWLPTILAFPGGEGGGGPGGEMGMSPRCCFGLQLVSGGDLLHFVSHVAEIRISLLTLAPAIMALLLLSPCAATAAGIPEHYTDVYALCGHIYRLAGTCQPFAAGALLVDPPRFALRLTLGLLFGLDCSQRATLIGLHSVHACSRVRLRVRARSPARRLVCLR